MQSEANPWRFGVTFSRADTVQQWTHLAQAAEMLGYDTVVMPDHLGVQWGPIAGLAAVALGTTRLRIGTLTLANDLRNPVVLAKELATLDVVSQGRLEVGIGTGWMETDYMRTQTVLRSGRDRLESLKANIMTLDRCLRGEPARDGSRPAPPTVQRPRPPVLIGGGGPRLLRFAASTADIINVSPRFPSGRPDDRSSADATAEAFDQKVAWIRSVAPPDRAPELGVTVFSVRVGRRTNARWDAARADIAPAPALSRREVVESPLALVGTEDEVAEQLREGRDRWGLSYIVVKKRDMEAFAPVAARLRGEACAV